MGLVASKVSIRRGALTVWCNLYDVKDIFSEIHCIISVGPHGQQILPLTSKEVEAIAIKRKKYSNF
jgi:hypothetical protein